MEMPHSAPAEAAPLRMPEPLAGFEFAVDQGNRILARISRVDLRRYESLAAATGVQLMMRGPVNEMLSALTDTMRLISTVPCLVTDAVEIDSDELELPEPDLEFDESAGAHIEPFEGDARPATLERFCEEVDGALAQLTAAPRTDVNADALGGLCHILVGGLREAHRQLVTARGQRSKWGLIAAAEDGRRKIQRALRACLCAAACLVDVASESLPFARDQSELASALRVRDTLLHFRADILRITAACRSAGPKDLRTVAQHAIFRIASLVRDNNYHELRALDRFNLRRFRAELETWLSENGSGVDAARQALLDLNAYVDLLASVNNREVLVEHDRNVKRQAGEELESCLAMLSVQQRGAAELYRGALERLQVLRWRDAPFGAHIDGELGRTDESSLEKRVFATLSQLATVRV